MSKEQDAAFLRNFLLILGALGAFTLIIIVMANIIGDDDEDKASRDPLAKKALEARIKPVGEVNIAGQPGEPSEAAAPMTGQEVVQKFCFACHGTGAAGAPKIGDKAAWQPRVLQGYTVMMEHAIHGFKGMPARGGNANLSDEDLRNAMIAMVEDSGLEMPDEGGPEEVPAEDKAPVSAPAAAAPAAAAPPPVVAAPVAAVPPSAAAPTGGANLDHGKAVYGQSCFACHGTGAAGAPKLGDKAAWEPRIAQGMPTLEQHAIQGFKAMPPKGGNPSLSDSDIKDSVAYIVSEGK